jgi:hypothetical protein
LFFGAPFPADPTAMQTEKNWFRKKESKKQQIMLSKRSLALTSVAYNLAAILTNLLVDILAPGPFAQC